jgi:hypothetical protein
VRRFAVARLAVAFLGDILPPPLSLNPSSSTPITASSRRHGKRERK